MKTDTTYPSSINRLHRGAITLWVIGVMLFVTGVVLYGIALTTSVTLGSSVGHTAAASMTYSGAGVVLVPISFGVMMLGFLPYRRYERLKYTFDHQ